MKDMGDYSETRVVVFNATFNYISFIGGGNRSTRRKPPTCRKSVTRDYPTLHNDQKFENTKEVIRRHKSMKEREHNGQKFEDTEAVIRRHKSMKDGEHNGQSLKIPKV